MRRLLLFVAAASAVGLGCSGDSSSLMWVWSDAGASPETGGTVGTGGSGASTGWGSGGQVVSGGGRGGSGGVATDTVSRTGGAPGQGGAVNNVVPVPGGLRDAATGQCVAASGGACYVPSGELTCPKTTCASEMSQCYSTNGSGKVVGGVCLAYAECLLASPCDANKDSYEMGCLQKYAISSTACWNCLVKLATCISGSCPTTTTVCTSGGAGSVAGSAGAFGAAMAAGGASPVSGGVGGSSGYLPADAGPVPFPVDAGPIFPLDARGVDVRVIGPPDLGMMRDTWLARPDAIILLP